MTPKISVIIPAYNLEDLIGVAISAISRQDYPELEIIVVDDGSNDTTCKMAENAFKTSPFSCRLIKHGTNKGVAAARNTGIENVSGDYFLFFDGDDSCDATMISDLFKASNGADVTICGHRNYTIKTQKTDYYPIKEASHVGSLTPQRAAYARILNLYEPSLSTLYRTQYIKDCQLKNYEGCTAGEDGEFFLKSLILAKNFAVADCCPYIYIEHSKMGSNIKNRDIRVKRYGDNAQALERCCRYIFENANDPMLLSITQNMLYPETLFRLLSYAAMNNDHAEFTALLQSTPISVFLSTWKVLCLKPEYFFKAIGLLTFKGIYYSHYRKKTP